MKILLFALTGMGNAVLRASKTTGAEICLVVTRKEKGPFPYYKERDLADEARSMGLSVMYTLPSVRALKRLGIEVLLTTTYHQFIPEALTKTVSVAVNLHPSLLPKYRGASPCFWVIRNGEKFTGLTIHELTPKIDEGRIWDQMRINIDSNETQGSLRQKLAKASGDFVFKTLEAIFSGQLQSHIQDEREASNFPRFLKVKHGRLNFSDSWSELKNHFKALTPWPGLVVDGKLITKISDLKRVVEVRHFTRY